MKKTFCVLLAACAAATIIAVPACGGESSSVSAYDISVTYNADEHTLTGTMEFDYFNNTQNALGDLKFNLYGNAYREGAKYSPVAKTYESKAYYGGKSYGGMEITSVEGCAGWTVGGEDENILTVNLAEPVYPDRRAEISVSYKLSLANINHRTGVTQSTVNLGNFYPVLCAYSAQGFVECPYYSCGDPFVSDCADYSVTLQMPATYTAASSGKLVSSTETEGGKKCEYTLSNARDFAIVLSDKFKTLTADADGTEVTYYYVSDAAPDKSLNAATESLKYFSSAFGKYAYPTLSVVETGFCYGGMEYPALTMIAEGQSAENTAYTIIHENAHQWWYAMVGSDQINDSWQDEGLAEYSTLLFYENHPEYGLTRTAIVGTATKTYRAFFSVLNQLNGSVDTSMHRPLSEYSGEYEYVNVTYNKGLILFDTLRSSIGDKKFMQCLASYFSEYCGKIASYEDLEGCFIKSGTDLEGFFTSFIEGKIII